MDTGQFLFHKVGPFFRHCSITIEENNWVEVLLPGLQARLEFVLNYISTIQIVEHLPFVVLNSKFSKELKESW